MRKALLDEQLPRAYETALAAVNAVSVHTLGWAGTKNGELLRRAAVDGFTVFVTMDRHLRSQQNLGALPLGVVLIRAPSTRLTHLLPLAPAVAAAIAAVAPGEFREVAA